MFASLDVIAKMRKDLDALEAEWLTMVRAYDTSQEWRADGYLSCAAALRNTCNLTHGMAAGHVTLAAKLERLPEVADAFAAGDISRQHAHAIADAYTPERAEALDDVMGALVDAARKVNAKDLRALVKHVTDAIDGDGGAADDNAKHERRRLHASTSLDGMLMLDGLIDKLAGEYILTALDTEMQRDHHAGDTRSQSQRRADALTNICRRDLERGSANSPGVLPHIMFTADLKALHADQTLIDDVRNEAAHTGKLSHATLEQLACDCSISRVITNGPSEVLDVGRATRVITPALRKAVIARDRTCTEPGCNIPADRCDIHHITPWSHGGPTNLANLTAKCGAHHWQKHHPTARDG